MLFFVADHVNVQTYPQASYSNLQQAADTLSQSYQSCDVMVEFRYHIPLARFEMEVP
jgi:hypothetical protein